MIAHPGSTAHRSRPVRRRRPLAARWLRISWPQWWATDPAAVADEYARWLANQNRATVVRPCPAFRRLDALMSGDGKILRDYS